MQNATDVHFQEVPDDYFGARTGRHKADTRIRLSEQAFLYTMAIQDLAC